MTLPGGRVRGPHEEPGQPVQLAVSYSAEELLAGRTDARGAGGVLVDQRHDARRPVAQVTGRVFLRPGEGKAEVAVGVGDGLLLAAVACHLGDASSPPRRPSMFMSSCSAARLWSISLRTRSRGPIPGSLR